MEFARIVCLESIIKNPSTLGMHGMCQTPRIWFTLMYQLSSERYVLTFIDNLSHYTWIYFLKNKSHIFEQFKEFRTLDEKKCGKPIKCLRFDNGGEYVSR